MPTRNLPQPHENFVVDVQLYWELFVINHQISVDEIPEIQRDHRLWESVKS
jgi:hypothetical protein